MEVRKDFSTRVADLSRSTPREAIANLLSALMPRVQAKVRAPAPPMGIEARLVRLREQGKSDQIPRVYAEHEPAPMRKRRSRKPLPIGKLSYLAPNPKKPGSKIRAKYEQYQVGKSAYWHSRYTSLAATDILWDIDHGFIIFTEEN